MSKSRFFSPAKSFTVDELANISGCELQDNEQGDVVINDVSPLDAATEGEISFLDNQKYLDDFKNTKAAACFIAEKNIKDAPDGLILLISKDPYKSYAKVAQQFYPREVSNGQIHPSAIIDDTAKIANNVEIRAGAVIEAGAEIGENAIIYPNAVIGKSVIIGDHTIIGANASVFCAEVGSFSKIYPGARIGQDGFGFAIDPINGHQPIPQLGRVLIGDRCEVGANATIDRGAGPDTIIGDGTFIDNLVQIGHNVKIGRNCVIVAQTGLSGSSTLEDMVVMAGQSATVGHIKIGAGTQIAGQSAVMRDCPPGSKLCGSPAVPAKQFFRQLAKVQQLAGQKSSRP